jgi:hypothetical protein
MGYPQPTRIPPLGEVRSLVAAAARQQIAGEELEMMFDAQVLCDDLKLIPSAEEAITEETVIDDDDQGRTYRVKDLYRPEVWGYYNYTPEQCEPDDEIGSLEYPPLGYRGWCLVLSPCFTPQASILSAFVMLSAEGEPGEVVFELD